MNINYRDFVAGFVFAEVFAITVFLLGFYVK